VIPAACVAIALPKKLFGLLIKGVQEYWIVDWRLKQMEVYRRQNAQLVLIATLLANDEITSPLLPKFGCQLQHFF